MKLIFICLLMISVQNAYSQVYLNKFDNNNKKTGLWIDSLTGYKTEYYYKAGLKHGMARVYYKNGSLSFFGEYKNGHLIGNGYFFDDKGYLSFSILYKGFVKHKGKTYQKGFFTIFEKTGRIKESGTAIFKEGEEEFGEEIRMGDWKE